MALSDEQIDRVLAVAPRVPPMYVGWVTDQRRLSARAIEAEVRKDDEALIRQMLESMCWAARVMIISEDEAPGYFAAISAARARLERPCA